MYHPFKRRRDPNSLTMKVLTFGIAKDIVGGPEMDLPYIKNMTVAALKKAVLEKYPQFGKLNSLAIAVNNEYADDHQIITPQDEIVLIPPVSGG